jgi:hypothetical protein
LAGYGCHTARQNCWVALDEIVLVIFKTFPASRFVETEVHVNKSGEFWMM